MRILSVLVLFVVISATTSCSWLKKQWTTETPKIEGDIQTGEKQIVTDISTTIILPALPQPPTVQDMQSEKIANT